MFYTLKDQATWLERLSERATAASNAAQGIVTSQVKLASVIRDVQESLIRTVAAQASEWGMKFADEHPAGPEYDADGQCKEFHEFLDGLLRDYHLGKLIKTPMWHTDAGFTNGDDKNGQNKSVA